MVRTAPHHREEGLVSVRVCVCVCAVIHLSFLIPPSVPSLLDYPHTTLSSSFSSLFPCSKSENRQWLVGIPPVLARTREEANLAVRRISRELVWKIHFEKAQVQWIRHSVCDRPALQWRGKLYFGTPVTLCISPICYHVSQCNHFCPHFFFFYALPLSNFSPLSLSVCLLSVCVPSHLTG
jgi:hypothetical protein